MGQGEWADGFGFPGPGLDGTVFAVTTFDDGTGPALYAGGSFVAAGERGANHIAKWNGSSWSPLASGLNAGVLALTVFDDGTGPALYAAGGFTTAGGVAANNVAKWNGSGWSPLGSGTNSSVLALTVFDDGTGPALYAGGDFTTAGGISASDIAKWDGSAWSSLGRGIVSGFPSAPVRALTVFNDGTGPALYAAGAFRVAGGRSANRIARWNGSAWSPLGSGIGRESSSASVHTLTVFDDGTGPELYAGGFFQTAGGGSASNIAKWNGSAWSPLGSGTNVDVLALTVFDDGTGRALYAGGFFTTAGGVSASHLARWEGSGWSALGSGITRRRVSPVVFALTEFDDGTGPALYAGGVFRGAGSINAHNIAEWNGSTWSPLADSGLTKGLDGPVSALTVFDDGTGSALYAGGNFTTAGGVEVFNIARWDGAGWFPLGRGLSLPAFALTVFDDGFGPALYAGGLFETAGVITVDHIAKWNGSAWSPLGSGLRGTGSLVKALTVFDDGTGPALYAGGVFDRTVGVAVDQIAKWDGSAWSPLGSGTNGIVSALAVFDDGTGPALYVGGGFKTAGSVSANGIARWNGSDWFALGSGIGGTCDGSIPVVALTVFDDGTGPALYAGGCFSAAGGVSANSVAQWNGSAWSPLGSGMSGGVLSTTVSALFVFDDGTGPALYAGGTFAAAGGVVANNIAKWDGSVWSPLSSGMARAGRAANVSALTARENGPGATLYAGGDFGTAGGKPSSFIAAWRRKCNGNGICDPGENSCGCPIECGAPPSIEVLGATCADGVDNDCDGLIDSADPDCAPIPTVSAWGLIVLTLLLLSGARVYFDRRNSARP